jgi:hypothetical protein
MNSGGNHTLDPDPGLGERLRELEPADPVSDERLGRMYTEVKRKCEESDKTLSGFLRSRSTAVRRLIVLAVFATLAIAGWYTLPVVDESVRGPQWIATLLSFCLLLIVAMVMVTRPVHRPALPRWQVACLIAVAIGATVLAAFWPGADARAAAHPHDTGVMVGACMGVGLLLGVPVYALLRLVDRGSSFGNLVAAAAAGLAGNFVLEAHCSIESAHHVLLGHASVAILFVVGLGLVHRWIPSK